MAQRRSPMGPDIGIAQNLHSGRHRSPAPKMGSWGGVNTIQHRYYDIIWKPILEYRECKSKNFERACLFWSTSVFHKYGYTSTNVFWCILMWTPWHHVLKIHSHFWRLQWKLSRGKGSVLSSTPTNGNHHAMVEKTSINSFNKSTYIYKQNNIDGYRLKDFPLPS